MALNPWVALVIVAVLVVVGLSVAPYPGHCNVKVTVGATQLALIITTYFSINSVNAQSAGTSTILDWSAWLAGFGSPSLTATFSMTVTADSGQSVTKSETQLFPSVPLVNGQSLTASDTFMLGQVPTGTHAFNVALKQGSAQVASGSGSTTVGC